MRFDRFDALTRQIAAIRNRRDLMRAAVAMGIALGAAVPGRGVHGQERCGRGCAEGHFCLGGTCVRACEFDRHCRSNKHDPCIIDRCDQGACVQAIAACPPGYECCRGECCPKSCASDDECAVLDPCRWGQCSPEGVCVFTITDPCVLCTSDAECYATAPDAICCDGACYRPCPEGTTMSKGCECRASASATLDGIVVRDDASG